jgi:hypothetical protein
MVPMHLGLNLWAPLCPISIQGSPVILIKFLMAPRIILLISSASKKKGPSYPCLSEAKDSHPQRIWAEVSSSAPHLLYKNGLSDSSIRWRCLLRILCPVRRPVTALDCVLLTLILLTWRIWWAPNNASKWQMGFNSAFKGLKDRHLALAPRQGPEINSRACLWVLPRPTLTILNSTYTDCIREEPVLKKKINYNCAQHMRKLRAAQLIKTFPAIYTKQSLVTTSTRNFIQLCTTSQ